MSNGNPVRFGVALAATVGVGYTLCTVAFWLWPDAAATFMNALFHGLEFRKLQAGTTLFSFGAFGFALAVMLAWALGLGTLFGWFLGRLGHGH